jgi:hypothetical protein
MPELQPKMRDALLAASRTPSHSLRRANGGYIATGGSIRTSGPVMYQAFTRRTVNRLHDAGLVTFDEPEFPTQITLTSEGERIADELTKAGVQ